jgi:Zn finger protein HypA/HybF involved in hydrogenase expression
MSAVDPQSKKQRESILFGKLAVREGLLTAAQANECLEKQEAEKGSLGEILVAKGFLTAEQVRDLLASQEKKIMYCPTCILTFTVLTISQGKKAVSCPRCKGPLAEGRLADSTGTDAEFSTKVLRATKRELPPGSLDASRVIPPEAVKTKTTCVICDQPVEGKLDSTGRLRCPVCHSTFVPK